MRKSQIRRWWFAGLVLEVAAFAASLLVPVGTRPGLPLHGHPRTTLSFLISCALVALAGIAVQVVAWVKALAATRRARDATWHRRLLRWGIVGGALTPLLGLGAFICWAVMLDYLRTGPDAPSIRTAVPSKENPLPRVVRRERV